MMDLSILLPILISFAVSAVCAPILIPFLKKLKVGQTERDEGPQSHLKKSGTPTMGGIVILLSITITALIYVRDYPKIIPVLFLTLGFGLVGFIDDYIKVVLKRSMGLKAWQKMLGQMIVASVFVLYIMRYTDVQLDMKIPFWEGHYLQLGVFTIPAMYFIVIATVNGTNLTDGLDGLASSVTVMVATFFTVVSIGTANGLSPITCAVAGALLGFLLFNVYPAKVFMGDTGSLALGGFVAGVAYMTQMPLFIPIVGFIYMLETVSDILQVTYFKATHGKRIFKMAPIHHHFELCGYSETQVVAAFSVITALLCLVGMMAL